MPADDLVLNVRQIAGYPPVASAPPAGFLVLQIAGLGSAYASISPATLVGTALAQGGDMTIAGALLAQSFSGGKAQFSNASANVLWAQKATVVNFCAQFGTISGVPIATVDDVSALDAALRAATVWSFNGRTGDVRLWIDDILCAGGAPLYSPRFWGDPRAPTPPPTSNSSRLATTAFVATALGVAFDGFAPIDSPNFTGVPTAPTAAVGSSDGQLATTAFVQNAVTESTTGVASFNARTGTVILLAADVTSVGGALLASPAFTGVPIAPTATPGTSSTQLATCAFVSAAVAAVAGGVSSFNSRTGAVDLTAADVAAVAVGTFNGRVGTVQLLGNDISAAGGALLAGPAFTGAPTAPTAALGTTTTQLATTAFVQAAVASVTAGVSSFNTRTGAVTLTAPDISAVGGALLAGPTFTGIPTAPTATLGTSSAQIATCAFVAAAVSAGTAGVASFNARTGAVTLLVADISGAGGALIASPAFTGIPTAPTAAASVSTNQLATCAFVQSALPLASTAAPLMNGTVSAGAAIAWSRGDHVHPSDTSRLALTGGTVTGNLGVGAAVPSGSGASGVVYANNSFVSPLGGTHSWNLNTAGTAIATGIMAQITNTTVAMQLSVWPAVAAGSPTGAGTNYTFDPAGQVAIAGPPNVSLNMQGSATDQINFNASGAWGQIYADPDWFGIGFTGVFNSTTAWRLTFDKTGGSLQYLNGTTQKMAIDINGNMTIQGALTQGSDAHRKERVEVDHTGLDVVLRLVPKSFYRRGQDRREIGFVAQDVNGVLPEAVVGVEEQDGKAWLALDQMPLIAALVNSVKTLAQRLDQLEAAR
jgi:hypothetical protein